MRGPAEDRAGCAPGPRTRRRSRPRRSRAGRCEHRPPRPPSGTPTPVCPARSTRWAISRAASSRRASSSGSKGATARASASRSGHVLIWFSSRASGSDGTAWAPPPRAVATVAGSPARVGCERMSGWRRSASRRSSPCRTASRQGTQDRRVRRPRPGDARSRRVRGHRAQRGGRRACPRSRRVRDGALATALMVTTGGTGFGPRDVTPEATRAVLDREAPGLAELMRAAGLAHTPMAALSRGVAGTVGRAVVAEPSRLADGRARGTRGGAARSWHTRSELAAGVTRAPSDRPPAATTGATDADPHAEGPRRDPRRGCRGQGGQGARCDPPCAVGNAMTIEAGGAVHGTLGCAEFDAGAVAAAAEVDLSGAPAGRVLDHELGTVEIYLEPHRAPDRVLIVSATDVARALRGFLGALGRDVVVVEPRSDRREPAMRHRCDRWRRSRSMEHTAVVFTDHDAPGCDRDARDALPSSGSVHRGDGKSAPCRALRAGAARPGVRRRAARPGSGHRWGWTSEAASPRRSPCRSPPGWWPMRTGGTVVGWIATRRARIAVRRGVAVHVGRHGAAGTCPGPGRPAELAPNILHRPHRRSERRHDAGWTGTAGDAVAPGPGATIPRPWVRFSNAFLDMPLCCPSRASILTGLTSPHTGVQTNTDGDDLDEETTLATWLHDAGYTDGAGRQVPERVSVGSRAVRAGGLGSVRRQAERTARDHLLRLST